MSLRALTDTQTPCIIEPRVTNFNGFFLNLYHTLASVNVPLKKKKYF